MRMEIDAAGLVLGASTGIGLAAASGFRVFLPPFLLSLWFRLGLMDLNLEGSDFELLTSDMALIVMGSASLIEILAYKVPFLDNALDTVATPLAGLAGASVVAVTLQGSDPVFQWAFAIIAGGGTSIGIQTATVTGRGFLSAVSLGAANPVFSMVEDIMSLFLILIALLAPFLALIGIFIASGVLLSRKIRQLEVEKEPNH